tara:strand:+ start:592 stop:1260 length:669 start_codon:yes stop_codon:yes gene_type:complete
MTKRNRKNNQLGIPNLYIVGGGFTIVMLIGLFMLNYDNYRKTNAGYSYQDLKEKYNVISENEVYSFMNSTFFKTDSIISDSMEFTKVKCFSKKHSSELKSFIKSTNDTFLSSSEKKYMKNQLINEVYLWDNERFVNVCYLTPKDMYKINLSDTTDYWEECIVNFGNYGHHNYSKPIFNKKKTVCIIEHSGQGGWLFGSGDILLFKKINGNWVLIHEENLWIS